MEPISDLWQTPLEFQTKHDFDPCPKNPTFNGLEIKWHGNVFCNPPYSEIHRWIKKAEEEKENCESIIMLLPVWSSQIWFKRLIESDYPIHILTKKIHFEGIFQKIGTATFRSFYIKIK